MAFLTFRAAEQLLARAAHFDPAITPRHFVIAMRDSHELSLLPQLAQVTREHPSLEFAAVRIERRDLEDDLQSGDLDLALDIAPLSAEIKRERIRATQLTVLARRDHPAIQGTLDLATYVALDHVLVTGRRRGVGYEDLALTRLNLTRRVRVRCQQHAAANELVSRTDLLLTMPSLNAERVNERTNNQLLPIPTEIPNFELYLYWHANVDEDPANQWFRDQVRAVLASR